MASFWDPIDKQNIAVKTAGNKKTGGFWDNIETTQQPVQPPQPKSAFRNVPVATDWTKTQPMSSANINNFPNERIKASQELTDESKKNSDYLNSPAGIVLETIKGLPAAAKKIILETPAREGGGAVLQVTGQKEMQPQNAVEKFVLGNEPVKPLGEQGKEVLQGFGAKEESAQKFGLPVGIAMLALDAWPGGGKPGLAKTLAQTKNAMAVESVLKRAGVAEDLASAYSETIASMTKEKEVLKALDSIEGIQKSTSVAKIAAQAPEMAKAEQSTAKAAKEAVIAPEQAKQAIQKPAGMTDEVYSMDFVKNNTEDALANYDNLIKKEFETDTANIVSGYVGKYAIPGFDATKSGSYHEAGSAIAKVKFNRLIEDATTTEKPVLFLSGGTGSGKTTAIRKMGGNNKFAAVWDGNLDTFESSVKKIDKTLQTGREVKIVYVQRDPVTAFRYGVIPRVAKEGRTVPMYAHIGTHSDALNNVLKLKEKYGDDISVAFLDNTGKSSAEAKFATLDELPKFSYNESEISNKLYGELNQAIKDGKINQAEYDSFIKGKTASNGAGGGANVVERPAQIQREGGSVKPAEQSGNVKIPQTDEAGFLLDKKTAQVAENTKVGQAIDENRIPNGKDQAGKVPESQPEKNIQSQTPQSEKKVYSLKKQYTETEKKSIMKKAVSSTGDNSSIVKRVTNSINKVMTDMTEYFQNEHERVRQLVERKDVKITDESDPYLKMTLYPGRVAEKITKTKDEIKEIVKEMEKEKVTRKEISDYLVARHAPERNASIGEKAAGITTADAKIKLAEIETSDKGKQIKKLADKVQDVNNKTLDLLKDSGVISNDLYETLHNKYKYHVPLNRIMESTEDIGGILSGKGFNVASTGIKKAKGSDLEVSDIMTNVIVNYEQAVLRSEKNIVDQATLAFARKNKDIIGDLLIPARPMAIGKDFKGKIMMERTTDPTILQLFENGKPVWIKINDKNLAVALRGIGREKLGGLMNAVASFTRLYSGLQTRFNPEFALPNKIRDLQETATYLAAQNKVGFKGAAKMVARDAASVKDVVDYLRGADNQGAKLYREMKEAGGTTGGFGLSTRERVELNLQELEKMAKSNVKKSAQKIIEYVDNWNTIFEDSTRLSVYKQAIDSGLSKDRAAAMAKEASINFNRMGKGGPVINSLWMFSNASIQGSTKMIRALKNPKVLGTVVATIGGATAAVNQYNDIADPDWREKVPKWDRLNGLPVVLPSSGDKFKYVTIPVSWGIKPIKVMADYAYDAMSGAGFDSKKMAQDTLTAIVNAYNPAGGSDFVSSMIPTIADTPVEIARNTSWSGAKIKPDYDKNAPADIQYFSTLKETQTGKTAIGISEALQKNTGISISPADIKYAYDQYVGGAGRFISKTTNMISSIAGGKDLPIDEYPIVSRFYKERTNEEIGSGTSDSEEIKTMLQGQSRERFEIKMKAEDLFQKIKNTDDKNKKKELLAAAIKETPEIIEKMTEIAKDESKGLNYHDRLIKQLGVDNGERANYILGKIKEMATVDEKKQYLSDLKAKGLITSEVVKSIIEQTKK